MCMLPRNSEGSGTVTLPPDLTGEPLSWGSLPRGRVLTHHTASLATTDCGTNTPQCIYAATCMSQGIWSQITAHPRVQTLFSARRLPAEQPGHRGGRQGPSGVERTDVTWLAQSKAAPLGLVRTDRDRHHIKSPSEAAAATVTYRAPTPLHAQGEDLSHVLPHQPEPQTGRQQSTVVKSQGSGASLFKSWLCHLLSV